MWWAASSLGAAVRMRAFHAGYLQVRGGGFFPEPISAGLCIPVEDKGRGRLDAALVAYPCYCNGEELVSESLLTIWSALSDTASACSEVSRCSSSFVAKTGAGCGCCATPLTSSR